MSQPDKTTRSETMPQTNPPWQAAHQIAPGKLMKALKEATERGLETNTLVPIPTSYHVVPEAGLPFQVRVLAQLQRKAAAKAIQVANKEGPRPPTNPFLPYEPTLFVGDISPTHVGVLNKFNVLPHHMLLITRSFVPQESLLDETDFEAAWRCLQDVDGLIFYNGGEEAGASQPHKHLQLVLLPLTESHPTPLSPLLDQLPQSQEVQEIEALAYLHGVIKWPTQPQDPQVLQEMYHAILSQLGLPTEGAPSPANLLLTREWMMIIPRSQEFCGKISINSLGFVGCLLARTEQDRQYIEQKGPLQLLAHVGFRR